MVAHIENPYPTLKITACYDDEGILITNTLMSFELSKNLEEKFLLGYLNSKFLSSRNLDSCNLLAAYKYTKIVNFQE